MPDRPTTVLQVLPRLESGGVERGTVEIAEAIQARGWRALVAAERGRLAPEIEAAGGRVIEMALASKNPMTIYTNARRLTELVRAEGVDLIHARSRAPAWSAQIAAKRAEVPFVTTFHSIYSGYEGGVKQRYNAVMAAGDRVIAISDFVADHLRTHYGVKDDRLRTIYRPVDLDAFDPAAVSGERVEALRRSWGLSPDRPVVLLPGRVARRKGHVDLLRAISRLRDIPLQVLFVGPFEPVDSYVKQIELFSKTAGLADLVTWGGQCDDMPAAYKLATVVAVPSVETPEAFGRVSVEAQAMGVPVVVNSIGGLPETLMPAATGWLVTPGATDELAEALRLALSMPLDVRERASSRARSFVTEHFSLKDMQAQTLAVYDELLGAARR